MVYFLRLPLDIENYARHQHSWEFSCAILEVFTRPEPWERGFFPRLRREEHELYRSCFFQVCAVPSAKKLLPLKLFFQLPGQIRLQD